MRRGAPARAHAGPAVHLAPARPPLPPASQPRRARRPGPVMGIEVEMDGIVVRIGSGASPQAIAAWACVDLG